MSYGARCKHCPCYAAHHDAEGVCRVFEMGHGGWQMKEPCDCPGFELQPNTDWVPCTCGNRYPHDICCPRSGARTFLRAGEAE